MAGGLSASACGFLPSPALPLLPPRSSLAAFAAEYAANTASSIVPASKSIDWGRVLWSVAEDVCYLPRIEKPSDKIKGDGIYVEKTLFDAFLPFNAILSSFLAFVTAAATELTRTGLINDLVTYLAGEEDQTDNLPPSLPWDWAQVGHDTVANLTKDTLGQTLTRSIEISAKPMLTRQGYCELLKHPHKAAFKAYKGPASRLSAKVAASKVVVLSPTFYVVRSLTAWIADVFVDGVAWSRGQLSTPKLKSNIALKCAKYALFGAFSFVLGTFVPVAYPHPYVFLAAEQLVGNLTAETLVGKLGVIEPS